VDVAAAVEVMKVVEVVEVVEVVDLVDVVVEVVDVVVAAAVTEAAAHRGAAAVIVEMQFSAHWQKKEGAVGGSTNYAENCLRHRPFATCPHHRSIRDPHVAQAASRIVTQKQNPRHSRRRQKSAKLLIYWRKGCPVNTIEIAYMVPRIGHQSHGFGYGLLGQRRFTIEASDIGAIPGVPSTRSRPARWPMSLCALRAGTPPKRARPFLWAKFVGYLLPA
jgi:hypothetical protein